MGATARRQPNGREVALLWIVAVLSWVPLGRHLTDRPLSATWLTMSIVAAVALTVLAVWTSWQALDAGRGR